MENLSPKLIQITAPHFVAGATVEKGHICTPLAPIIRWMKDWPLSSVIGYCKKKGWKIEIYK